MSSTIKCLNSPRVRESFSPIFHLYTNLFCLTKLIESSPSGVHGRHALYCTMHIVHIATLNPDLYAISPTNSRCCQHTAFLLWVVNANGHVLFHKIMQLPLLLRLERRTVLCFSFSAHSFLSICKDSAKWTSFTYLLVVCVLFFFREGESLFSRWTFLM